MKRLLVLASLTLATPLAAEGINANDPADIVAAWSDAVVSGNPARVDEILAPEFQILRGSGAQMNHEDYVASELPIIAKAPGFELLEATENNGVMVVTYILEIEASVDGQTMQRRAPRLTVFREIGGAWYVVAHSNFAAT